MDRAGTAAHFGGDRDLADVLPAPDDLEDAADSGYVTREAIAGFGVVVMVTEDGERLLRAHGRLS